MTEIYNLNADTKVIAKSVVSKRIFDCENTHVGALGFEAREEIMRLASMCRGDNDTFNVDILKEIGKNIINLQGRLCQGG